MANSFMKTLHVIGDSISLHYGPYLKAALNPEIVYSRKEGRHGNLDVPTGANGGDSSQVLQYLEWLIGLGFKTDVLVVNCGLHDIKRDPVSGKIQIGLPAYQENLRKIVACGRRLSQRMFWISSTPVDDEIHRAHVKDFYRQNTDVIAYNEAARKIMTSENIPVIDLYAFTAALAKPLYCDHVHFIETVREQQWRFLAGEIAAQKNVDPS
jgi:lysophospholipase L1-like esterase